MDIMESMRILVVEDDRKVARFIKMGLEEEHYVVDVVRNGNDALRQAVQNSYDVIVLDVMLPGMDGMEICQALRDRSVLTPIIMLTARDSSEDKIQGLTRGADDYLTKPFAFDELLARLRALMRRNQEYKTGSLKAGPLSLDPYKREVNLNGKGVDLTGKEYSLLEYLLTNRGRILSPTKIIEHVWSMESIGDRNLLNVYINHLRQKIDRTCGMTIIHTVRGYGYKIEVPEEE